MASFMFSLEHKTAKQAVANQKQAIGHCRVGVAVLIITQR